MLELRVRALYALNHRYQAVMGLDPSWDRGNGLYRLTHRDLDPLMDRVSDVLALAPDERALFVASLERLTDAASARMRGYEEKGNINTPLELAILNQADRFNLVIDVIYRVPRLANKAAHLKESMKNEIISNLSYAREEGTDRPEISDWTWPR